ncbi:MAG TPA: hypothetical protein VFT70_02520 [Nocardioides sp.]|nr:hypothetical protein [Nocardioides sp.]
MSVGPRLPRRAAIGLAAAGLAAGASAVAGCDDGSAPASGPTPAADPDVALVDEVMRHLRVAERVARSAGEDDLAALHRAHLEALDGTASTGGAQRTSAPGVVRTQEQKLRTQLASAALAAESGALARLLASMSAAVAQQLAKGTA